MENIVQKTLLERRTIRSYRPDPISEEQLKALLDAALISPTAMNAQDWHFSCLIQKDLILELEQDVVDYIKANGDPASIKRIESRNNKVIYDAPLLIVISGGDGQYVPIDAGIAVQSLAICAKSMGLDSAILGMVSLAFAGDKKEYWQETLKFPKGYQFKIAIAIGHGNMPGNEREVDQSKFTIIK